MNGYKERSELVTQLIMVPFFAYFYENLSFFPRQTPELGSAGTSQRERKSF